LDQPGIENENDVTSDNVGKLSWILRSCMNESREREAVFAVYCCICSVGAENYSSSEMVSFTVLSQEELP